MAKVPYKPTPSEHTQTIPTPYYKPGANPDVSGIIGPAANSLGKAVEGLANTLSVKATEMQDNQTDGAVNDLWNSASTDLGIRQAEYQSTQGSNAIDGYEPYVKSLEETRTDYQARAKVLGPKAEVKFNNMFNNRFSSTIVAGAGHKSVALKNYENTQAKNVEANAISDTAANYQDDGRFEGNLGVTRDAVNARARVMGWDPETHRQEMTNATDQVWSARIKAIGQTDPTTAREMLNKNKGMLGGKTQIELDTYLNNQDVNVGTKQFSDSITKGDTEPPKPKPYEYKGPKGDEEIGKFKPVTLGPDPDQGARPDRYAGAITIGGSKFTFVSGGGSTPSAPYGTYPITPGKEGPLITQMGGVAINGNTMWDPKLGRNREGIAFHPASGSGGVSAGCFVIPDGQWPAFKAMLQEKIKTEGPQYLTVNKDGSAFISSKPGQLAGGGLAKPSPTGFNQARISSLEKNAPEVAGMADAAASKYGVNPNLLKVAIDLESGGNPKLITGTKKGLMQLDDEKMAKYGGGDPFDAATNIDRAAQSLKADQEYLRNKLGREPTDNEIYMTHQQGIGGGPAHIQNPDRPAWESMFSTKEGRERGEAWSKKAIWGNLTDEDKKRFGSVENVMSRDILATYQQKITGNGEQAASKPAPASQTVDPANPTAVQTDPAALSAPPLPGKQGVQVAAADTGTKTDAPAMEGVDDPGPLNKDSGPDWLEKALAKGEAWANHYAPNNIKFKENLLNDIERQYNRVKRVRTQEMRANQLGMMTAVMGDFSEKMIRSPDQIYSNATLNKAFNELEVGQQKAVLAQIDRNAKADVPETPERWARFQELKGMAFTEPEKFLDTTIEGLPRNRMGELLNMQRTMAKKLQDTSKLNSALRTVGPLMAEAVQPVVQDRRDLGKMQTYNQFVGAFNTKLMEYESQNKKYPNEAEQMKIAQGLLTETGEKAWWNIFSNDRRNFELPDKWADPDGQAFTKDQWTEKFKQRYSRNPTPQELFTIYQRSLDNAPAQQ